MDGIPRIVLPMNWFFHIAMFCAMLGVLGVLVVGILTMMRDGKYRKKYGNKLMRARVILQGVVIAMLGVAYLVKNFG